MDSANLSRDDDDAWESENIIYNPEDVHDKYATRDISLTERGRRYYQIISQDISDRDRAEIEDLKRRYGTLPLRQLIRYVYQRPEYATYLDKSLIRKDILGQ